MSVLGTEPIRITVGGDFCPIGRIEARVLSGRPPVDIVFDGVRKVTETSDLFILNLECPLTQSGEAIKKAGPCVKAAPETVSLLQALGVGLVTLASNHMGDFGEQGLADTIEMCGEAGIATAGAGLTFEDARRIHYQQVQGRTLAIIDMAEQEFGYATPGRGGTNPFDVIAGVEAIRTARSQADHVLFIVHGGLENVHYPSPESVRTLRFLAEQGPSAIIRHHSHRVQGHEIWRGVPILYSLGNFLFDWHTPVSDHGWYEGVLGELAIDADDRCAVAIHPVEQRPATTKVEMLDGAVRDDFLERFAEWSRVIADERALRQEWDAIIDAQARQYLGLLSLPHPLLVRAMRRAGLLGFFRPRRGKRRILGNWLRCDTHRELLRDILERI